MPLTTAAGPSIYYETVGDPAHPPLVLISGAGAQMIWWRSEFVQRLVDQGLYVIRFDNRDVGMSAKIGGPEDLVCAYSIRDMAEDICRVLDALGIASANIVGQSLGGGIAQTMAINFPERVRSMTLFYTVPAYQLRFLTEELQQGILTSASTGAAAEQLDREGAIREHIERERDTRSKGYAFDDEWMLAFATESYDRGYCPAGIVRQVQAAMTLGDLSEPLKALTLPAAIVHGREDRLLKVEAGFELGGLIADSELHIYPGMGHEFPKPLWDDFVTIIARTAARAA